MYVLIYKMLKHHLQMLMTSTCAIANWFWPWHWDDPSHHGSSGLPPSQEWRWHREHCHHHPDATQVVQCVAAKCIGGSGWHGTAAKERNSAGFSELEMGYLDIFGISLNWMNFDDVMMSLLKVKTFIFIHFPWPRLTSAPRIRPPVLALQPGILPALQRSYGLWPCQGPIPQSGLGHKLVPPA